MDKAYDCRPVDDKTFSNKRTICSPRTNLLILSTHLLEKVPDGQFIPKLFGDSTKVYLPCHDEILMTPGVHVQGNKTTLRKISLKLYGNDIHANKLEAELLKRPVRTRDRTSLRSSKMMK